MAQEFGSGDDDLVFGTGEDTGELGMAEESVLRSIPAHRLRALEKQQTDATLSNNATRARDPPGLPGALCAYQHDCTTQCGQDVAFLALSCASNVIARGAGSHAGVQQYKWAF